jgi:hypothetical protein
MAGEVIQQVGDDPVRGAATLASFTTPPSGSLATVPAGGMAARIAAKIRMQRTQTRYDYRTAISAMTSDNNPPAVSPSTSGLQMPHDLR